MGSKCRRGCRGCFSHTRGGNLRAGSYKLHLVTTAGSELKTFFAVGEANIVKDGPHHGSWFTVATADLIVDERTAKVTLDRVDEDVWKKDVH